MEDGYMTDVWLSRFLDMAHLVASWSKDPSTKCGAVIVDANNHIVSVGYNGFPKGLLDTPERLENREYKYAHTVHAERNVMIFANQTYLNDCVIYITHPPCSSCLIEMKQRGICRVVCMSGDAAFRERWNVEKVLDVAKELGIMVTLVES